MLRLLLDRLERDRDIGLRHHAHVVAPLKGAERDRRRTAGETGADLAGAANFGVVREVDATKLALTTRQRGARREKVSDVKTTSSAWVRSHCPWCRWTHVSFFLHTQYLSTTPMTTRPTHAAATMMTISAAPWNHPEELSSVVVVVHDDSVVPSEQVTTSEVASTSASALDVRRAEVESASCVARSVIASEVLVSVELPARMRKLTVVLEEARLTSTRSRDELSVV